LNLSGTKDSGSGRKPVMAWRLPRFFFDSSTHQGKALALLQCSA
jgi:hypothetical protein